MSLMGNVNYMKRTLYYPCATPNPLLLIETAFTAALPVVFELLSADMWDKNIKGIKDLARKASARSNRSPQATPDRVGQQTGHGRKIGGKMGRRSTGRKISPTEFIFDLVDAEQTGMYYWLVAELATEFLARWTSLIYLKQGCPHGQDCYREGSVTNIFIGAGESPSIMSPSGTSVLLVGGHEFQQIRKGTFSISYQGRLVEFITNNPPRAARLELRGGLGGGHVICKGLGGDVDPAGGRLVGGFYQHDSAVEGLASYELFLVNDDPTQTVGLVDGAYQISSGICDNFAPAMPWDSDHTVPYPHGKVNIPGR